MTLIATTAFAQDADSTSRQDKARDCRTMVVVGNAELGKTLAADDFSINEFKDFKLTTEEFNKLSAEQQGEIYLKIRPLVDMVDEVVASLSQKINSYQRNYYYAYLYADELIAMQDLRSEARHCIKE